LGRGAVWRSRRHRRRAVVRPPDRRPVRRVRGLEGDGLDGDDPGAVAGRDLAGARARSRDENGFRRAWDRSVRRARRIPHRGRGCPRVLGADPRPHRRARQARRVRRARSDSMLTASDLWFGYDERTPVLRGGSLTVPADGLVGILGPNGSGKTTLLRMLAGTRRPQRGAVALDGAPLTGFSRAALARRMAVVPQEKQLAFDYTVEEVAMMGRYPHLGAFEIEGPRDIAVIDESLAATGTLQLKDRPYATLSGGEKQRVVIAAALAQIFRLKAEATGTDSRGFRLHAAETRSYLPLDEPLACLSLAY